MTKDFKVIIKIKNYFLSSLNLQFLEMKLKAFNIKYKLENRIPACQVMEVINNLPKEIHVETLYNDAVPDVLEELLSEEIVYETNFEAKKFDWMIEE